MQVGDEVWVRATLTRVGESGRGHRVHIEVDRVALVDGGGVAEIEVALKDIRSPDEVREAMACPHPHFGNDLHYDA